MKMKNRYFYVVILVVLSVIGGWWYFVSYGEKNRPTVAAGPEASLLGRKTTANFSFLDGGQGLRRTEITITQDNIPRVLSAIDYPEKKTAGNKVSVTIDAAALKLHDGPAVITASAIDHSFWENRTETVIPTAIDLLPPQIALYPSQNHINIGGACVVAWNLSEPVSKTGVTAGGIFYPAYKTVISGKEVYVSYFALPDEKPQGGGEWNISALAVDRAGNETLHSIPALIKKKKFHSDKLVMTDSFLNRKMPEFQAALPELRGKTALETFKIVNSTLRTENLKTIQTICAKTEGKQLWQDTFLRMKNSAPRAFFGDRRTYFYNGLQISESIHNGVDLASLANAPIEASNSGIVLFTGMIGIYGNSVIIDHGMGLSSIYSHLSSISAKPGQEVKRGEVIGVSGITGLSGGDHLHFGIAINGQFVDPVEWWDPHWIADNITKKLAL